ncbi:transposase [Streptomyces auratus]
MIPEKTHQAANRKKKAPDQPRRHALQSPQHRRAAIDKFQEWQRLATRYDKTPESYAAGLHLRGSILRLRSLPTPRDPDSA